MYVDEIMRDFYKLLMVFIIMLPILLIIFISDEKEKESEEKEEEKEKEKEEEKEENNLSLKGNISVDYDNNICMKNIILSGTLNGDNISIDLFQEFIEMRKELKKMKLEIIEAVDMGVSELSAN